jgi:BRCT domain type II-containing protein
MADILNSEDFSAVLLHKLIRLTGLLDNANRAAVLKKAIAAVTTSLSVLESRRSIAGYGPAKLQEIGLKFAAVREEAFAALLKALKALAKTGIDVATLSSLLEQMADLVKQLRSELQFDSGERLLKLAAAVSIQCQASVAARLPWK